MVQTPYGENIDSRIPQTAQLCAKYNLHVYLYLYISVYACIVLRYADYFYRNGYWRYGLSVAESHILFTEVWRQLKLNWTLFDIQQRRITYLLDYDFSTRIKETNIDLHYCLVISESSDAS